MQPIPAAAFVTKEFAAVYLGCAYARIGELVRAGELRQVNLGERCVRIEMASLEAFAAKKLRQARKATRKKKAPAAACEAVPQ